METVASVRIKMNDERKVDVMFEKVFKLSENKTTVRTELVAGLTTFMTMAYIIALNPNLLTNFATGSALWNGVFLATCIASAIGMFCMAFLANKPFAMAPGMGLNSFFAVVVGNIAAHTILEEFWNVHYGMYRIYSFGVDRFRNQLLLCKGVQENL